MTLKQNRPLAIGVVLAVLVAVALLAAVVVSQASDQTAPPAGDPAGVTAYFSAVKPAAAGQVQALPEEVQQILETIGRGKSVDALGVTTSAAGEETVLADLTGTFCAFESSAARSGGTCGSREEAVGGELLSISFCQPGLPEGSAAVFGVMPDGIATVSIETAAGKSQEVDVTGNTYETQIATGEDVTIHAGNDRGRQIAIPVPLTHLAEANGNCG